MRRFLSFVVAALFLAGGLARSAGATATAGVVFHVYDTSGHQLSWTQFRSAQGNGNGTNGDNDMLLDPQSLTVLKGWPLYQGAGGNPAFDWTGQPVTLSMAWPTSDGYSALLLDVGAPGTYDFTVLAATQAVTRLDAMLAARPGYQPSAAFSSASLTAHRTLAAAGAALPESAQGALGAQSYDAAVHAVTLLLAEYGVQYAKTSLTPMLAASPAPAPAKGSGDTAWGVTFDDISGGSTDLQRAATMLSPRGGDGWVRIVFDRTERATYYAKEVASAHAAGLHVVGQLLDSSDMSKVGLTAWKARVDSYLSVLPSVDEWEVGNEVNGSWLGSGVVAKVAYAANAVKTRTGARTLVTLYWQLGEDKVSDSMFTWAKANLSPTLLSQIDDVGLSVYPEDHPMGAALDRVFTTLHAQFPLQRLMITELDYWSPDLGHQWWWGSKTDPTGAGRLAVASLYSAAVLGYSYTRGGTFWWYFLEEMPASGPLWSASRTLHQRATGTS